MFYLFGKRFYLLKKLFIPYLTGIKKIENVFLRNKLTHELWDINKRRGK
jgi:hypothetical protein